jgi:hypothetical protein
MYLPKYNEHKQHARRFFACNMRVNASEIRVPTNRILRNCCLQDRVLINKSIQSYPASLSPRKSSSLSSHPSRTTMQNIYKQLASSELQNSMSFSVDKDAQTKSSLRRLLELISGSLPSIFLKLDVSFLTYCEYS